jgi:hypothetical protein
MSRILRRAAILACLGVLVGSGTALSYNGIGNSNGWDNKNTRGCPSDYTPGPASAQPFADLNGDGTICGKVAGNSTGTNYIDNISNH